MTYSLGVDLGTTTSAAALRRSSGLEVCRLGDLTATMPSVVLERADRSLLVGEAAADRIPYDPTLVARHVTAHLGDGPIVLDGRAHDPVRLTQALLETVIDRVRRLHGDRPHDLVLTYPLFPAGGSPALLERVGAATVGRTALVPHAVAAAAKLAHDVEIAVGTTVAVLDLGGGTFEATIVRRTDHGFDVVGSPGGLPELGGVEFDDAVFARVDAELGHVLQGVSRDDVDGMAALRRLRVACRSAKEWLSSSPDTTVEVALPHLSTWVPIRRAELEREIRPALMAAVDVVAQTIAASGLAPAEVHVALLVGGSSRIPLFAELVSSRLGLPIVADPFPELTVALGAALFGGDDPPHLPPPMAAGARAGHAAATPGEDIGAPASPHVGNDVGPHVGNDVGALAAWFADPTAGPTHTAAAAPGPGAAAPWDALPDADGPPPHGGSTDAAGGGAGQDAAAWDAAEWDGGEGDAWVTAWDPGWESAAAQTGVAEWEGGEWSETIGPWDHASEAAAATAVARRGATPTTGETDLWGPPSRRRVGRRKDDADDDGYAASGDDKADGANPRLIAAIIGGALAIVGIAGVALAMGMGGPDDHQLTLADPAGTEITTTTTSATSTEPPPTTTTAPPTTTTTAPPTTTTTTATTTTCPPQAPRPGPPGQPTTTTTAGGDC
ncbi:MAG TPA: Hsp70 family protein [Acidimicrobiales bacterium]|nr:Hsp70 family protein [Acidimicrobiales bacterium]